MPNIVHVACSNSRDDQRRDRLDTQFDLCSLMKVERVMPSHADPHVSWIIMRTCLSEGDGGRDDDESK